MTCTLATQLASPDSRAAAAQVAEGLAALGYQLAADEVAELLREVALGEGSGLGLAQFLASQMDWRDFQVGSAAGNGSGSGLTAALWQ